MFLAAVPIGAGIGSLYQQESYVWLCVSIIFGLAAAITYSVEVTKIK